jgi:hypothetical protein
MSVRHGRWAAGTSAAFLLFAASCLDGGLISGGGAGGGGDGGGASGSADGGPGGPDDGGVMPDASIPPGSNTPSMLEDGSQCFEGTYTPFWGDLHAHLKNHTDPVTCDYTAREMFDEGKRRGLNFLLITEHVWRLTATGLSACKSAADLVITDSFRPGCGFETNVGMADGSYSGHANAFFVPSNHNTDTSDAAGEDFYGAGGKGAFYSYVGGSSGLGQINHPNSDEDGWPDRASQHADDSIKLVEVSGSCGGCADRDAAAITSFLAFVEQGWQVGPSMNSDTHCLGPGRRTGLWVVPDDHPVIGAIEGHRTFVQSYDPPIGENNQLSLRMAVETSDGVTHQCWMGSRLARPGDGQAPLRVVLRGPLVSDGAPGSIAMKIFARGRGVTAPLASTVCGEPDGPCTCEGDRCAWDLSGGVSAADTDWLVAYAESSVGGTVEWTLTAPVWLF